MPASFQQILNSRLFKFIVGEKADGCPSEFWIHEEAIAQLSKPLHTLLKGGMKESHDGSTTWPDVSKETFERFAQFAYTGDYTIPEAEKRIKPVKQRTISIGLGHSDQRCASSPERLLVSPIFSNKTKKKKKKWRRTESVDWYEPYPMDEPTPEPIPECVPESVSRKTSWDDVFSTMDNAITPPSSYPGRSSNQSSDLSAEFHSLTFPLLLLRNNHSTTCDPASDFPTAQDHTKVLLSHASLYTLADYHLIDSLKALTLYKLHKTLSLFEINEESAGDVIALTRYAYSEAGSAPLDEKMGVCGLRELVCQYVAINAVALSSNENFLNLLAEGGQLVKDFFKYTLQKRS